jgi:hypothetical protein
MNDQPTVMERYKQFNFIEFATRPAVKNVALFGLEILILLVWTLVVTRPYQNFDSRIVPAGRELLSTIQIHHIWEWAKECGVCSLWYGGSSGGFPAFVDPQASPLNPLVIISTLLWGVINGSKVVLIASFFIAGIGQWWLGLELGLGRIARLWTAGMAVAAGHLAARMDLGAFSLVLSEASAALIFPAVVRLTQTRSRQAIVLLAFSLAFVAVSGNGYMQVGLAMVLPLGIYFLAQNRRDLKQIALRFGKAVGIAILLAGPFLLPFLHFLPKFGKDFDLSFRGSQPFPYVPLNLVIRDTDFFVKEVLGKPPWPSHYINFVGWVAVLFAVVGLLWTRKNVERRAAYFLGVTAFFSLWISSGTPLAWLVKIIKIKPIIQLIGGFRYPAFIAGLAVTPLLGLAAIGLDRLIETWRSKLRIRIETKDAVQFDRSLDLRWLLAIPLILSLHQAYGFGRPWIRSMKIEPFVNNVISALETPDTQWVNVPWGEHFFVEPAIGKGLKLSPDFFRTWHWSDRPQPEPILEASRGGPEEGMIEIVQVEGIHIHRAVSNREYAVIEHPDGSRTVCHANATGGKIDVDCGMASEGTLLVKENRWSGWRAYIDDERARLQENPWLSVKVPAGTHEISFHYRPWDVLLGVGFFVVGFVISVVLWRTTPQQVEGPENYHEVEAN